MKSIAFRPAELGTPDNPGLDARFVVDAWVATYRNAKTAGMIAVEDWYAVMIPQVWKVLRRPDVQTIVAAIDGAVDRVADLIGFITVDADDDPPLVYYVFIKEHYRRGGRRIWPGPGAARQLFEAAGVDPMKPFNYVCSTPMCRILERKIPMARWMPALGRFPKHERRKR